MASETEADGLREALLPCPFCGAAPVLDGKTVDCPSCDANQLFFKSDSEAIAAWNRRTPTPDARDKLGADVVALLDRLAQQGGTIVCTSALTEAQITIARAEGRLAVDADGIGYVWVPGQKYPPAETIRRERAAWDTEVRELRRELDDAKLRAEQSEEHAAALLESSATLESRLAAMQAVVDAARAIVDLGDYRFDNRKACAMSIGTLCSFLERNDYANTACALSLTTSALRDALAALPAADAEPRVVAADVARASSIVDDPEAVSARLDDIKRRFPAAAAAATDSCPTCHGARQVRTGVLLSGLTHEPCPTCADIPPTPADGMILRPVVRWFAEHMERKLREHDDREGWLGDDPKDLLDRLREETDELEDALSGKPIVERIYEAADVANFAMMVADTEGPEFGPEREAKPDSPRHLFSSGASGSADAAHGDTAGAAPSGSATSRSAQPVAPAGDSVTRAADNAHGWPRVMAPDPLRGSPVTRAEVERIVEEGVRRERLWFADVCDALARQMNGSLRYLLAELAKAIRAAATAGGKD